MRRLFLAVFVAAVIAAPAFAQVVKDGYALAGTKLREALFGIEMSGYSPTFGFSWRECIQPNGDTMYYTPGGVMHGKLTISGTGQACFAYEDDGYRTPSCYTTKQTEKGLRFEGEFDSVFITTKIVKGVTTCSPDDLIG